MKLVIAEKPSVAKSIAKVLRAGGRQDGYLEGSGYLVSWCIGHLVELADASAYDKHYSKWALSDLPILPEQWAYSVLPDTKKQFLILQKLMAREDVTSLVCATDAGREGELIFRLVYNQTGCRKPVERLWISSMEDSAIEQGFRHLQSGTDYDQLYRAALCRAQADWLVGINGTRLFSVKYNHKLNVGRVVTPTLALIVQREKAIADFKSSPFIWSSWSLTASRPAATAWTAKRKRKSCSKPAQRRVRCPSKRWKRRKNQRSRRPFTTSQPCSGRQTVCWG